MRKHKIKLAKQTDKKLTTSRVVCTQCDAKKGLTKDRLERLVGQFGSLETLHANYVCRKCRKEKNLDRAGRAKPEKRRYRRKTKLAITPGMLLPPDTAIAYCKDVPKDVFEKAVKDAFAAADKARKEAWKNLKV